MGRSPCREEISGVKKGPWTPEEDEKLIDYITKHSHGSWRTLPKRAGLNRCGKSCRLRWTNYLRPDIKRGQFTEEDERTIINLHSVLGNKYVHVCFLRKFTLFFEDSYEKGRNKFLSFCFFLFFLDGRRLQLIFQGELIMRSRIIGTLT